MVKKVYMEKKTCRLKFGGKASLPGACVKFIHKIKMMLAVYKNEAVPVNHVPKT
jgi:hypothetical protein